MTEEDLIRVSFIYPLTRMCFTLDKGQGESVKPIKGRFHVHICLFTKVEGAKKGEIEELL